MVQMKTKTVIIALVLFMMISGIKTEDQQTNTEGLVDNTEGTPLSSETDLNQHSDNFKTLNKDETGTTKEKQEQPQAQHLDGKLAEPQREYQNGKLEQTRDKKQNVQHQYRDDSDSEEEEQYEDEEREGEEENEYADDSEEDYQRKIDSLEMQSLSHQAKLFNALNLDQYEHKFEDWSVSLDEEFEDMIRVLGQDDNLPLRDEDLPTPPRNASHQHGSDQSEGDERT